MLLSKETLVCLILHIRRNIDLPTDEHTRAFLEKAPFSEILEIWDGLKELTHIFHNVGNRTFAFARV